MTEGAEELLLTTGDVAAILGVNPTTVVRWATVGTLPCTRTPSGHRRFAAGTVRRLREARAREQW